jgi:hypothetical protein
MTNVKALAGSLGYEVRAVSQCGGMSRRSTAEWQEPFSFATANLAIQIGEIDATAVTRALQHRAAPPMQCCCRS